VRLSTGKTLKKVSDIIKELKVKFPEHGKLDRTVHNQLKYFFVHTKGMTIERKKVDGEFAYRIVDDNDYFNFGSKKPEKGKFIDLGKEVVKKEKEVPQKEKVSGKKGMAKKEASPKAAAPKKGKPKAEGKKPGKASK